MPRGLGTISECVTRIYRSFHAAIKRSMSPETVFQPKLILIAVSASAGSTPMADSTAERVTLPDEQAAPCADADPRQIQRHDLRLGLHARHRDAGGVDQPRHIRAEDHRRRAIARSPASSRSRSVAVSSPSTRGLRRRAKARDAGDILGAGTTIGFLSAAPAVGGEGRSGAHRPGRQRRSGRRACARTG